MNASYATDKAALLAALHRQISVLDNAIRIAEGDTSLASGVPPVSLHMRRDRARAELADYLRSLRGKS